MSNCDEANLLSILALAERELAAFLEATADLLGADGRSLLADTWFRTMESSSWLDANIPNFFRSVSLQAIYQIVVASLANRTVLFFRIQAASPPQVCH